MFSLGLNLRLRNLSKTAPHDRFKKPKYCTAWSIQDGVSGSNWPRLATSGKGIGRR